MIIFILLAYIIRIYSILIFIRIILSWFGNIVQGGLLNILAGLTDPYLAWWRRNLNLRIGVIDFSVLAGIAFLSIIQIILFKIYELKIISLGIVLSVVLSTVWSVVSFILGFYIVVLILRLIALLTNRDIYSTFWQIIDSITRPVLYRINRILFGDKISYYYIGIIASIIIFIAVWIAGILFIPSLSILLMGLPF